MNKAIMALALLATSLTSCKDTEKTAEIPLIEKSTIEVKDGIMTPEVLYSFGRLSNLQLSPDKSTILYGVTYVGIEENKTNRELFTIGVDGKDKKQLTKTPLSESNEVWINGGKKIAFLSSESGSSQLWVMKADGSDRKQISNIDGDIQGFKFSPNEKKYYTSRVFLIMEVLKNSQLIYLKLQEES